MKKALIKKIFSSIQGEGTHVGEKHLFIRFCGCNLNCAFCDTDFDTQGATEYSSEDILKIAKNHQIISLTGGEPLLHADFLLEFLPLAKKSGHKIYLETNGTLYEEIEKLTNFIDIVSMDIKIPSASKQKNCYEENIKFLEALLRGCEEAFVKVVFDKNITDGEIKHVTDLLSADTVLVLQPKMPLDKDLDCIGIFEKFYKVHKKTRLIPQCHKFLGIV